MCSAESNSSFSSVLQTFQVHHKSTDAQPKARTSSFFNRYLEQSRNNVISMMQSYSNLCSVQVRLCQYALEIKKDLQWKTVATVHNCPINGVFFLFKASEKSFGSVERVTSDKKISVGISDIFLRHMALSFPFDSTDLVQSSSGTFPATLAEWVHYFWVF